MIHKLFSVVVLVTAGVCAAIPSPNRQDQGKDAKSSNVAMPIRKNKFEGKVAANGEVLLKVDPWVRKQNIDSSKDGSNDVNHRVGAHSTARKQVIPVRKHTFEGKVDADGDIAISDEEKGSPSQDERNDREAREDELMVLEEEDSDTRAAQPESMQALLVLEEEDSDTRAAKPKRLNPAKKAAAKAQIRRKVAPKCLEYIGTRRMMTICRGCVEKCKSKRGRVVCFEECMADPKKCVKECKGTGRGCFQKCMP